MNDHLFDRRGHFITEPCDECGDAYVTPASHALFCKGLDSEPWKRLPLSEFRIILWKDHPGFKAWAKAHKIKRFTAEDGQVIEF